MYELQYKHPITCRCVSRYFKKFDNIYKHIEKFHSPLSYYVSDLENHDFNFYGYYDPITDSYFEGFDR